MRTDSVQLPRLVDPGLHQGRWPRRLARLLLGGALCFAGVAHLTFARTEFRAQVPEWMPLDEDAVVLGSGVVEIALGSTLVLAPRRWERPLGWVTAAFFTAVFPGNLSQFRQRRTAFGLDTDRKRFVRLLFQPLLVAWALWATGRPRSR